MKKILTAILCLALLLSVSVSVFAEETNSGDIVILYTNDVHTYIDKPLSYDVLSGIKKELEKQYENVLLVDAGDHIQGTAYGSMDNGETVIELMNAAGYDLATLGNHEFDYGMDGMFTVTENADFPYVSCNFHHVENGSAGDTVFSEYEIFELGSEKVAVIGITTPETFTKSTPAYFQDENGSFIYGISAGDNGEELYAAVQAAIDSAKAKGATKIIALGHLGDEEASKPYTSEDTIAALSGLDAFIDGHSHSVVESKNVKDLDGKNVLLTQTGEYFDRIGIMLIDGENGNITTDFIEYEEITQTVLGEDGTPKTDEDGEIITETVGYSLVSELYDGEPWVSDDSVSAIKDSWVAEIDDKLSVVVGRTDIIFDNYDGETRLVRSEETNTGDLAADSLYYLFDNMGLDVDVAIMNGGGVRNKAVTGDLSYKTAKTIHTFGNVACLQTVTGQQLLDALEWGARNAGSSENGGFLQVSGITYKIDTSKPSTVQMDDMGIWTGAPTDGYRVHSVMIYNKDTGKYEPLETEASYNLAGYNYTLRELGDGFAMFGGAVNVLDYVMEDYMVLANYIKAFENGTVEATNSPLLKKYPELLIDYSSVKGSGRIVAEAAESSLPQGDEATESSLPQGNEAAESSLPQGDEATESSLPQGNEAAESNGSDLKVVLIILAVIAVSAAVIIVCIKNKKK